MIRRKFTQQELAQPKVDYDDPTEKIPERLREYPVLSNEISRKKEEPVDPHVLAAISPAYIPGEPDRSRVGEWAYVIREYRNLNVQRIRRCQKHGHRAVAALVLYEVGAMTVYEIAKVLRITPEAVRFLVGFARGRKWAKKRRVMCYVEEESE